jgi:predicted transcriptional regulator
VERVITYKISLTAENSSDKNTPNSVPFIRKKLRPPVGSNRASQTAWRQERIMRYLSMGYSQTSISEMLGISQAAVSQNVAALTKAAEANINKHIEETLPFEYEKARSLYEEIKNRAVLISDNTEHDRDRISALALAKDCEEALMELQKDGGRIKKAIKVKAKFEDRLDELEARQQQEIEEVQFYRRADHE